MKKTSILVLVLLLGAGGIALSQTNVLYPLLAPLGSDAAPSYSFTGQTGTGMQDAGGNLTFDVVGAQMLLISSGGLIVGGSGTTFQSPLYRTGTNCSSSASPAVCGSASAGMFVLPAAATSVTVNTTAVTANSEIIVLNDDSLGTRLSVTCNTGIDNVLVSARVAGTSFTITGSAPVTNPNCYSYLIVN